LIELSRYEKIGLIQKFITQRIKVVLVIDEKTSQEIYLKDRF